MAGIGQYTQGPRLEEEQGKAGANDGPADDDEDSDDLHPKLFASSARAVDVWVCGVLHLRRARDGGVRCLARTCPPYPHVYGTHVPAHSHGKHEPAYLQVHESEERVPQFRDPSCRSDGTLAEDMPNAKCAASSAWGV